MLVTVKPKSWRRIITQESTKSTNAWLAALLVLLWGCGAPAAFTPQSSSEWQTIDVHGLFSFRLPPGFTRRSAFNVVEERGEWAKGETKLGYVWGRTESPAYEERREPWMKDYQETTTRFRGRRANIRTYSKTTNGNQSYYAELNVGNWEKGEVQLYMQIEGTDPATTDLANQIFKTVTLPFPQPERPA